MFFESACTLESVHFSQGIFSAYGPTSITWYFLCHYIDTCGDGEYANGNLLPINMQNWVTNNASCGISNGDLASLMHSWKTPTSKLNENLIYKWRFIRCVIGTLFWMEIWYLYKPISYLNVTRKIFEIISIKYFYYYFFLGKLCG
jgi:hypothetical protein